jgi:hypothetical protein
MEVHNNADSLRFRGRANPATPAPIAVVEVAPIPETQALRLVRRSPSRATSASFDPAVMLARAVAGDYPAAERKETRAGEIAYWEQRCDAEGIAYTPHGDTRASASPVHVAAARNAWRSGGNAGLGLWLASFKEKTTNKRAFTTDEVAYWAGIVQQEERDADG